MATLHAHTFTPIPTNLDDNTILNNANRVAVSKIKAHQTSFVNHVSKQQQQTANNNNNNNNNINTSSKPVPRINGTTSPKPHTTSQNHPPKIKLLNRSLAVTQAPPTKESNGTDDDLTMSDTEPMEHTSPKPDSISACSSSDPNILKLNRTHSQDSCSVPDTTTTVSTKVPTGTTTTAVPAAAASADKDKKEKSTPLKYSNTTTTTPPKQSSFEYSSSPSSTTSSLNRENSLDYKDSTGVDLHEFMVKTLKENPRDRLMLLKLERDFTDFINDVHKMCYKYPPMTSYHRMLIHRVAAYFGLDHNVDSSGKSVVISKTPASRIPEVRFQSYCSREYTDEEISAVPKSILLRSTSSEEAVTPPRYESPLALDRRYGLDDKQGKSIEEREEDYIKAKERIFKRESLEMDVVAPISNEVLEKSSRHADHISPSADSTQSEKEAAIAAVAAATGNKQNSNPTGGASKRLNDRRNVGLLRFSSPATQQYPYNWPSNGESAVSTPTEHYSYGNTGSYTQAGAPSPLPQVDGYPPGATIQINPQTGQPVIGPDGNPIYYQAGYQQPAGNVAFVANGNNAAYVSQQNQYIPYYYVSATGQQSTSGNPPQGSAQQYYIMQPAQSGHYVYMPAQGVAGQSPSGSLVVSQQPHPGDYNAQMANLTLTEQQRRGSIAREDLSNKSQPSTPTSPADASSIVPRPADGFPPQARQVVYYSNGRAVQAPVYDQSNYPLQMYPGVYATYPVNQEGAAAAAAAAANQASTPTVPAAAAQRSPAPNIIAQQYNSVQNPRPPAPSPQHVRGQVNHSSPRPRFVSGIISNPRAANAAAAAGSAVYLPVANGNQATMLIAGQYPNLQMNCANVYPVHDAYRHSDKNAANMADSSAAAVAAAAEYQKVTQNMNQQTRNLIQVNQQRPIIQLQPTYPTYQAYITHPQRFVANPAYTKQAAWPNGSSHRKYRNSRNQSSNQQIRISRPNSSSNDADQKTVSHILEIYDFPSSVTSDADAIFDEIKSSGARILKINSSSSQSLNNSHGGGATNQKPTILAIFKSAGEAQRALESVTSPYYKLRVSQKSPTHFAGSGDNSPTSSLVKTNNSN